MDKINCNNCMIGKFKYALCKRCSEMKRLGTVEEAEEIMVVSANLTVRKRGRWKRFNCEEEDGEQLIPNYRCSYCLNWSGEDSNYCPNCGADMRGEQ